MDRRRYQRPHAGSGATDGRECAGRAASRYLDRAVKFRGRHPSRGPDHETGSATDQIPPPFSLQELVPSTSPPWRAIRPYWLAWIEVNLDEYGDTETVVKVRSDWKDLYRAFREQV